MDHLNAHKKKLMEYLHKFGPVDDVQFFFAFVVPSDHLYTFSYQKSTVGKKVMEDNTETTSNKGSTVPIKDKTPAAASSKEIEVELSDREAAAYVDEWQQYVLGIEFNSDFANQDN